MVRKQWVFSALFVCLLSASVSAQEALSVSPTTLTPNDESFLTIFVSGLSDSDIIDVRFDGAETGIAPSFVGPASIIVWVPAEVMLVEGRHSVDVYVTRATGVLHFGPGYFSVSIPTEEPPTFGLVLPEVIVGEATSSEGGVVDYFVASTDGTPVDCSPASGSVFGLGLTRVNCTATNAQNQTASGSFPVIVSDLTAPVLTVPDDISTDNPVVTYTVTAVDAIDTTPAVVCSPSSGSSFPSGVTTVRCYAVDDYANYAFGSFKVTVTGGAPVLELPDDIFAEATSAAGAVVNFVVTATENGVVTCTPPSGSTFAIGQTTVNCSATNTKGTTTGSFTVNVYDSQPPVLNLSDMTVEATSLAGATVTFATTATDVVDGTVPMTCDPASGTLFPFGTTLVQCTAADAAGNAAYGSFNVNVVDSTPPTITSLSVSPDKLWPPDHKMVTVTVTAVATDTIDPSPVCKILQITSNQPINGTGDGDMAPDWRYIGDLTAELRAERSGNKDRVYSIKVECSDFSGNATTDTVKVTVANK